MNFRYELNNQINQLPDHIRRNERVKTYVRMVIGSFETMLAVFGPNVLDIDINWNHLIGQIAAIRHVEQDNWPQHIDYFNLDNYQANDTHSEEHNENNEVDNNEERDNMRERENNEEPQDTSSHTSSDTSSHTSSDTSSDTSSHTSSDSDSEYDSDDDSDDDSARVWVCERCLTYTGGFQDVSNHERNCYTHSH